MRKMRRHRLVGTIFTIFIYFTGYTRAQENFEDAEKLSDLLSASTGQQFDLRHTIPGIPDVDYPIYSEVPKTSFECSGRHEGYYADMESRCQVFRICTHTARAPSGFGFLCPNGTLFSQKNFVCDWYRNVDCDDSERYYNKNDANRIGSSEDMMETVRRMMEYPMKTISKALQQNPGSSRNPTQRHRNGSRSENQKSKANDQATELVEKNSNQANSARKSVTRIEVESAQNRGTKKYYENKNDETAVNNESSNKAVINENNAQPSREANTTSRIVESSNSSVEDDVYVNSLGELSTDPGVHFDRTNAHIIAEPRPYRYQKNMNFAAKVNAALNDEVDVPTDEKLAPDYVKQLRDSKKSESIQNDLVSNINGLLDEVANDLNPSSSGYQIQAPSKSKHSFKFLSRGFSSQDDPYTYTKPKQTASTIHFTPNQLPLDDEKLTKKPVFEIADDAVGFGHSSTTTTTLEPPLLGDALDYLKPPLESPAFDEISSYLEPPLLPPIHSENSLNTTDESAKDEHIITTTPESEVYTVAPVAVDLPSYAALVDTTSTETLKNLETTTTAKAESSNQRVNEDGNVPFNEDRLDVNKQAEKLFFSGLKLTANENETEVTTLSSHTPFLIHVPDDHSYLTAWITSTDAPNTVTEGPPTTTTEATATEATSLQERIRNYRRLTSLQKVTAKPVIYGKRGQSRVSSKITSNATTTAKPSTSTRNYLKRVAASRLRLSRLAAAAGKRTNNNHPNPTSESVDNSLNAADIRKIAIRNIDKETAVAGNGLNDAKVAKSPNIVTWEEVRSNLERFQVGRKKPTEEQTKQSTLPPVDDATTTTARISLKRSKSRNPNFKMPASIRNREKTNSKTKAAATTQTISSSSSSNTNSAISLSLLTAQNSNSVQGSLVSNTASPLADNTNLNSNSASSTNSPTFISFDNLKKSIVSNSILQNYRAGQTLGRTSVNPATESNPFHARLSPSSIYSNSALSSNAHTVSSHNAYSNEAFTTPIHQSFSKIALPAPSALAPPESPVHLPVYPTQISSPLKRTTPGPSIVIARAEGQRIDSNSVSSILSSLITEQQQQRLPLKPTTSYVPLDDFLTKEFGNQQPKKATQIAAAYYQQPQPQQYQLQQQQQTQPQINEYRQQPYYQQVTTTLAPPQPVLPTIYRPQNYQQQQLNFNQQSQLATASPFLQPLPTRNIFTTFQQQQQQLPQFPPLAPQPPLQPPPTESFQKLSPQLNSGSNYFNIQLPTLSNGLLPVPTLQTAQKRNDVDIDRLELTDCAPIRSIFSGATSYDVPLNSVGRLPNDKPALLRRLRRRY